MRKIAIIGGGYNGLAVASNLIRLLRKNKKFASITVFDGKGLRGGRIFAADLANNFRLNHEANNMGAINAFADKIDYDDFFKWIQKHKFQQLESLNGGTLAFHYAAHDIGNPLAYLPRSLYGHYLEYRLAEMMQKNSSEFHEFAYKLASVKDILKKGQKYVVSLDNGEEVFDGVVLATGFWFHKEDNTDLAYTLSHKLPASDAKVGIIGTSLSALEVALSLADRGYTDLTLYSRHGRLPKVRGIYNPKYPLQYLTHGVFETLQNKFGFLQPELLLGLMKKEFDFAYESNKKGLYQAKGIKWQEIFQNTDPMKQLDEDIRQVENGEELLWRSVLMKIYEFESELWRGLSASNRKLFLQRYSSLLLSFVAPMPLWQAKKLREYIQKGVITIKPHMTSHRKLRSKRWEINSNGKTEYKEFLLDARGPAKEIRHNEFIMSLVEKGFLELNHAGGVKVNPRFQAMIKNKPRHNVYVIGPMVYGERPHNSTTFGHDYSQILASYVVNSIGYNEQENEAVSDIFDPNWLQFATG